MQNQKDTKTLDVPEGQMECNGIHELIDWQIVQYRQAVATHRLDLSRLEGRCVAWQDAEMDFSRVDRESLGEKSRVEYCGLVCPERSSCLIALYHLRSKKTEPLFKVV